ncbi:MAG: response regulator [Candidatus Peregrinibacteria bacterium]
MNEQKPTIMVIEDEDLLTRSILAKLEKSGFSVFSRPSGEESLKALEEGLVKPDLIWLDYYLRGKMNGIDFLEKIQQNKAFADIPVISVSNTATQAKVQRLIELGVKKHFMKAEYLLKEIIEFIWSTLRKK